MRWNRRDPDGWHRWFAWYPVVIESQWVWLEKVERRICSCQPYPDATVYEYRNISRGII